MSACYMLELDVEWMGEVGEEWQKGDGCYYIKAAGRIVSMILVRILTVVMNRRNYMYDKTL